ncbi:hypothetical protein B296_00002405 [Ensete ventricosum]|uniref:Uncharacterized protein n=1 Tax=Ensete ventricosum TaxID=4639 RepID=A0A427ACI4_ENSVE|nr:hypothetical protein B296_00002405 [Ensete ventricosum]
MPTFTAVALERLLEPASRDPASKPPPAPIKVGTAAHITAIKNSIARPNISPALYATPKSTPLPDSPTSFPPESPYMINHKRRGPRLAKSLVQNDAGGGQPNQSEVDQKVEAVSGNGRDPEEHKARDTHTDQVGTAVDKFSGVKLQDASLDKGMVGVEGTIKLLSDDPERDEDAQDFFDMRSTASNSEVDDSYGRWKPGTPLGEYYDALEEISSDGTSQSSYRNIEDELREMRFSLLMEIQKRKQAEEELENLQSHWDRLSHHLSLVGFSLPLPPIVTEDMGEQVNLDPAEELSRQIVVARSVADAVGRGCARAEVESKMESQIASKNFEIARLLDRLHYYEAANREMSRWNQEAVGLARQKRDKRKRRQKWFWSSVCVAITLGGAAITWSYLPSPMPNPPDGGDHPTTGHQQ